MGDLKKGYLFVFLTSILFAINTIAIRHYFADLATNPSVHNVAFWSLFAASLFLSPYFIFTRSSRIKMKTSMVRDGKIVLVVALLSASGAYFWYTGLKLLGAGPASLTGKSQVLFTALLGIAFLRERFSAFESAGIVITVAGIAMISQIPNEVNLPGVASTMLSAFIYSVQSLVVKKYATELHGIEFSYLRAVLMALMYGVVFAANGMLEMLPLKDIFYLGGFSLTGLIAGRTFYYEAHKYLGISRIGIGMLFEPVVILIASFYLLEESLGGFKLFGAALILFGLWMVAAKNLNLRRIPTLLKR